MKDRVVRQVTALSAHGPQPLANTLSYAGDSGLLGPDSVSWKVIGDAAAFVGGIRALLVQAAHPERLSVKSAQFRGVLAPAGQGRRTKAPLFAGGEDEDAARRDVQDVLERA